MGTDKKNWLRFRAAYRDKFKLILPLEDNDMSTPYNADNVI